METPQSNVDRLLTTEEVAVYLGYAVQTIYNKVKAGEIPVTRLPTGALRFRTSEIEEWVKGGAAPTPTSEAA